MCHSELGVGLRSLRRELSVTASFRGCLTLFGLAHEMRVAADRGRHAMICLRTSQLAFATSRLPRTKRTFASSAKEYKVTLDNGTLYVSQPVAEALGWKAEDNAASSSEGVSLRLRGWAPHYFTIAQSGSDQGKPAICSSSTLVDWRKIQSQMS